MQETRDVNELLAGIAKRGGQVKSVDYAEVAVQDAKEAEAIVANPGAILEAKGLQAPKEGELRVTATPWPRRVAKISIVLIIIIIWGNGDIDILILFEDASTI